MRAQRPQTGSRAARWHRASLGGPLITAGASRSSAARSTTICARTTPVRHRQLRNGSRDVGGYPDFLRALRSGAASLSHLDSPAREVVKVPVGTFVTGHRVFQAVGICHSKPCGNSARRESRTRTVRLSRLCGRPIALQTGGPDTHKAHQRRDCHFFGTDHCARPAAGRSTR